AVFVPFFGRYDKLPAILKVLTVNRERFGNGRDTTGGHQRVGAAQCAIQNVREIALTHRRGVKSALRLPLLFALRGNKRIVRAASDNVHIPILPYLYCLFSDSINLCKNSSRFDLATAICLSPPP